MIRFFVNDSIWPPVRLCLLATVIWMFNLLSGFNNFDPCLCQLATVDLLKMLQGRVVIRGHFLYITDDKSHSSYRVRAFHRLIVGRFKLLFHRHNIKTKRPSFLYMTGCKPRWLFIKAGLSLWNMDGEVNSVCPFIEWHRKSAWFYMGVSVLFLS